MKEKIRVLAGPVLIIVTLAIVLISGMADGALPGALEVMRTAGPGFLGLSALCYLGHLFLDAVSVRSGLRSEGYRIPLKDAVAASVRGNFFSNITPGATGAQESVFGLYFGSLIPGSCCLAAMLIWRFMTYYLGLIIGGALCLAERKRESLFSQQKRDHFHIQEDLRTITDTPDLMFTTMQITDRLKCKNSKDIKISQVKNPETFIFRFPKRMSGRIRNPHPQKS